jgi:hypothetical protein
MREKEKDMDLLGNVIRNLVQDARARTVKTASKLAMSFAREGMNRDQIEEMLFAGGYESDIVYEVVDAIPVKDE